MKAVQVKGFGGDENLELREIPVPTPRDTEVLIKVKAAGIIYGDVMTRNGVDPRLPELPYTAGMEVAGVIEAVGARVTGFEVGMRVMSYVPTGGYAEYATARAAQVIRLPDEVSDLEGLVYLINMPIAYLVYYVFGAIRPDATILMHAASGGVGTLVTQIAKRRGNNNTVIALASSDQKLDYCRQNGADHLINYKTTNYVDEVLRITGGQGVDVALNSVSGPTLETDPFAIRTAGRWAIYGYSAGKGEIDPFKHFVRSLTINVSAAHGYAGRPEFREAQAFMRDWLKTEALISPTKTFRLEEARAAHQWIEGQHAVGKTAFVFDD